MTFLLLSKAPAEKITTFQHRSLRTKQYLSTSNMDYIHGRRFVVGHAMPNICCQTVLNFADKYKYLGTTLDKEMTLNGLLVDVKKSVLNKLFTLRKLRKYITEKCSISIYINKPSCQYLIMSVFC